MGIIDDYYGGYENLAFYTNSDGEVDFEAAYESQMIDLDFGYELDPLDRAILYHTDKEMQRQHKKKSKTRAAASAGNSNPGAAGTSTGMQGSATAGSQDRARGHGGQLLIGWTNTGTKTFHGKPIYQGNCSKCHQQCTVPFAPLAGASPPMCKQCLQQRRHPDAAGASSSMA